MTEGTQAITTIHIVLMVVLALLTIAAIVAGMRLKRGQAKAAQEVEAHAEEAGVPPAEPARDDDDGATTAVSDDQAPAPERPLADEPIAAAIAPDGTTATIALDEGTDAAADPSDGPVTQLKGLGPKVAARLGELGIDRVGQIAALDDRQAADLDAQMGPFAGRIARDRWIEQARLLSAGDREGFERVFGRL